MLNLSLSPAIALSLNLLFLSACAFSASPLGMLLFVRFGLHGIAIIYLWAPESYSAWAWFAAWGISEFFFARWAAHKDYSLPATILTISMLWYLTKSISALYGINDLIPYHFGISLLIDILLITNLYRKAGKRWKHGYQ